MSRHKLTYEGAFDLLPTVSQRGHRKLRDIADDVARAGDIELPPRVRGRVFTVAAVGPQ